MFMGGDDRFIEAEAYQDYPDEAPKDPNYPKWQKALWRWCAIAFAAGFLAAIFFGLKTGGLL